MSSEFTVKVLKDMAEAAEAASDSEKQKAFEEEMELQKKRREKADELSLQALCAMNTAMVAIEKVLAENDVTIEQLIGLTGKMAEIGMSMGQLRMNMGGFGFTPGIGYGCGV